MFMHLSKRGLLYKLPKRDSFLAWFFCFLAASFFACELTRVTMFGVLAPALMKQYAVGATRIGMLSATFSLATCLFVYPAGLLLDKFPLKKVFISAIIVTSCATLFCYFSDSLNKLQIFLFFAGIGNSFGMVGSIRFINNWLTLPKHALAIGLLVSYGMVGGMFAQTPMAILVAKFNWQIPWLVLAIIEFIILVLIALLVPQHENSTHTNVANTELNSGTKTNANVSNFLHAIKLSLWNKQNWLAGTYTSFLNLPIVILGALWGISYLVRVYGFSQTTAANIVSMIFVGMILGSPFVGWVTNKVQSRKLPMLWGAILSIVITSFIVFAAKLTPLLCYILFFSLGFCSSAQILGICSC